MTPSPYIKAMHPKTEIRADRASVERVLAMGWVGQLKIHGHRVQIHISADAGQPPLAYNRQGKLHALPLSESMVKELRRLFTPAQNWNVIDAEWLKPVEKLFVFDFLKWEGKMLRLSTYPERWKLLPRSFISPHLSVLPLLYDPADCMRALALDEPRVEGLVFKSTTSVGFSDTSIVRCRKRPQKAE